MPELKFRKHELFCRAFAVEPNASKAALAAGYAKSGAGKQGHELLQRLDVKARLRELNEPEDAMFREAQAEVLDRIRRMAFADARDLTQFRIGACRYCHGVDHAYQWKTEREFLEALVNRKSKLRIGEGEPDPAEDPSWPDDRGGFGYRLARQQDPECPECGGMGVPYVHAPDSRDLSPAAALLFNGAKNGPNGIEIMMQDRAKPLEMLAKRFGLLKEQVDLDLSDRLAQGLVEILNRHDAAAPLRKGYET